MFWNELLQRFTSTSHIVTVQGPEMDLNSNKKPDTACQLHFDDYKRQRVALIGALQLKLSDSIACVARTCALENPSQCCNLAERKPAPDKLQRDFSESTYDP